MVPEGGLEGENLYLSITYDVAQLYLTVIYERSV